MYRWLGLIGLVVALGATACGPSGRSPGTCSKNADCASDAHCRARACVATEAPVASLTANADQDYWTNYLLHFDGTGAADPASGEHIVEYRWSFDGPLAALCPPVVHSPPGPQLDVYFPCAGEWDVRLVVVDGRGFAGAPTVKHISVKTPPAGVPWTGADVPPTAAPHLVMGETVLVDHRCRPDATKARGFTCILEDAERRTAVSLLADATAAPEVGGELLYAWTCGAPDALPSAHPALTNPTSAEPELMVETDGPTISGDYTCVVTVTDARQQRVSGSQLVRVGNRAPILTPATTAAIEAPHRLDVSGYVASAPLPVFTYADPDDDPVQLSPFVAQDDNAGSATLVEGAVLTVRVQKASPLSLLGAGVARSLSLVASDSNGGTATASWPVVVLNRAPRWEAAVASFSVPHAFDGSSYAASAALGRWVDDDGDPVELVPAGDGVCTVAPVKVSREDELQARADCAQAFSAESSVYSILPLLAPHVLHPLARDPWVMSAPGLQTVTVLDQPPAGAPAALSIPVGLQHGGCCRWEVDPDTRQKICAEPKLTYPAGSAAYDAFGVTDPEGDPVLVTVTPRPPVPGVSNTTVAVSSTTTLCKGGSCAPIWFQMPGASGCDVEPPIAIVDVIVNDGTGPVSAGSFTVQSY
jgi:hypothetical protein